MRISGKPSVRGTSPVAPTRTPAAPAAAPATAPAQAEDAVTVSGSVQLLALAQAELAGIPEIRTEKVAALREAIDADQYNPDGEAVADGIVREFTQPRMAPNVSA